MTSMIANQANTTSWGEVVIHASPNFKVLRSKNGKSLHCSSKSGVHMVPKALSFSFLRVIRGTGREDAKQRVLVAFTLLRRTQFLPNLPSLQQ